MTPPVLLPSSCIPPFQFSHAEWRPRKYLSDPQPPPVDEMKEQELAVARHSQDGKVLKKTRPRRTVDYNGGLGKWALMRRQRPNPSYVPFLRPSPPSIIDLLPPKAYPENASTSLCTRFVHTSTNKIRCPVNIVTWTPEARRVLTGSTSGEFTLWNGLTFNFETILQAHDTAICAMRFNHSGTFLASSDKNGTIKYFQPNMNNLTAWQGSRSREAIRGISFSPDDSRFATASDDSSIRIWAFEERREESVLTGHGWDVRSVEWHPTKGLLVSGSKDSQVKFWDPRTGTVLSTLHQHKGSIQALAWSPNGDMVASASRDQTVRLFDIRAMKEFRVLKGHKKEVCSIAWHPVHPILVSGGAEGAILHWDISVPEPSFGQPPAQPRATLSQAHDSNVWSLAFHPLGHLLVSASNDHTTRFWSRERPGDATSVFSAGGEKPPEMLDMSGQDDEEDAMVPGFGFGFGGGGGSGGGGGGGGWWGVKVEDGVADGVGGGSGSQRRPEPNLGSDDFVPGFGGGVSSSEGPSGRQGGPLPSQNEMMPSGGDDWNRGSGVGEDWGRNGGGHGGRQQQYNNQGKWGPRKGGPRY